MRRTELYAAVMGFLKSCLPPVDTELEYETPFQLLVAVVLSAQCTDKRVNIVTKNLFAEYPNAQKMSEATETEILNHIKTVSYPNSKARYLKELSSRLVKVHGGEVPNTLEQLVKLPGVGRKTANVILATVYKQAALAVDTHVFRVSHRLGLVPERCNTPLSVEKELKKHIGEDVAAQAHFWLLYFGRYTCNARKPKCGRCGLYDICRFKGKLEIKNNINF